MIMKLYGLMEAFINQKENVAKLESEDRLYVGKNDFYLKTFTIPYSYNPDAKNKNINGLKGHRKIVLK